MLARFILPLFLIAALFFGFNFWKDASQQKLFSNLNPPPDEVGIWDDGTKILGESSARSCPGISFLDVLLDKTTAVPEDYVPLDLVTVNDRGVPAIGHQQLRAEAANQLALMDKDMQKQTGLGFAIYSGFRTAQDQAGLYQEWSKVLGVNSETRAAPPGHSEHQLGTATDLVLANGNNIYPSTAWTWLDQNAQKYGFVMSYRFSQQSDTGYQFEPWHWRFVGVELATKIRYSNSLPQKFYRKINCH